MNPGTTPGEITRTLLFRFALFLVACLMAAFIIFICFIFLRKLFSGGDLAGLLSDFFKYTFSSWFKSTIGGLSFGAVIFIVILWQDALRREQKLREENLIFQNETLRNQVNPHFLFNSLNTLSSLMDTQPDTSKIFISRLSAIYRYILDNSHKDKVTLKSELDFVSDYFDLHKIRDEEKIVLRIDVPDAEQFWIIPVSLQILLENAIKHNIATRDNPLDIKIYLRDKNVIVSNNLQKMATQMKSMKIGLKNLAERVSLVTGKELIIEETENDFTVKVPLNMLNVLIVENEKPAAEKLQRLLEKTDENIAIAGVTETVEDTINWLQSNPAPHLILMDIQLDDGICFELFETIKIEIPVIFTTAYNEYALQAFKVNSVDYLLKPVEEDALRKAIDKYKNYHTNLAGETLKQLLGEFTRHFRNRFLIKIGSRFRSVQAREICFFYILERVTLVKNICRQGIPSGKLP